MENSSKTWLKKLWHIYNSLREHCLRIDVSMGAPQKKFKLTFPYRIPRVISKLSFCASLTTKKDYVWTDILKYCRSILYQIITGCIFLASFQDNYSRMMFGTKTSVFYSKCSLDLSRTRQKSALRARPRCARMESGIPGVLY